MRSELTQQEAMGVVFVNRKRELGRIEQLARAAQVGRPERHLTLVGVRRIGKSRLIEQYRDTAPIAVSSVRMDWGATTLAVFLRALMRATINVLTLRPAEVRTRADDAAIVALAATAAWRPDGQRLLEIALTFPEVIAQATGQPFLVVADEFPHLVGLVGYAPFGGRTAGVSRRTDKEALELLLGVIRAAIERPSHVGWVATGSSVQLL
jgi:hypothetical protein